MLKDDIYAAQSAIRIGIENSQELLDEHEIKLGRTIRSNRLTAERMELEIEKMKAALKAIEKPSDLPNTKLVGRLWQ